MEQFVGMSKTGSIKEAAEGLKNPQFLMLFDSSKEPVSYTHLTLPTIA